VIFQRTVNQTMSSGASAQFDGDIIMKIDKNKDGDFKQNYVYHDKNRYQSKDLNTLKFILPNPSKGGVLEQKIKNKQKNKSPFGGLGAKAKQNCRRLVRQEGVKVNGQLKKGYKYLKGGKVVKATTKKKK